MLQKLETTLGSPGPGFIIASLVLGPGSITIASRIGFESRSRIGFAELAGSVLRSSAARVSEHK